MSTIRFKRPPINTAIMNQRTGTQCLRFSPIGIRVSTYRLGLHPCWEADFAAISGIGGLADDR